MEDDFKLANLDLERAVLGQIIGYSQFGLFQSVGLDESVFFREEHISIYRAAEKLFKQGVEPDLVTVAEVNRSVNIAYLSQLPDGVPRARAESANFETQQLHKLADARACYYSALKLHKALQEQPSSVEEEVAKHLQVIDGARQRHSKDLDRYDSSQQWTAFRESLTRDEERVFLGIDPIDEKLGGIRRGEVCGIMARPGIGKTLFLGHLIGLAAARNINSAMFSLEMPVEQIVARLARSVFNIGRYELEDRTTGDQLEIKKYAQAYDSLSIVDTPALTMQDIERRVRSENNVQLVLIDHLGLVGGYRGQSTYDRVSSIAREVKELAKRTHTAVILAIQVSREAGGDGSRELTLGSARDSGIIEEVMDYLIAMRRPERSTALSAMQRIRYRDVLLFSILKNRHGEVGRETAVNVDPCNLQMECDPDFRFDDALETIGRVRQGRR